MLNLRHILIPLILYTLCSSFLLSIPQSTSAQERIRIGISAISLGFLPTVLAEKKGFYNKYGLETQHVVIACAIAANALLNGDLDYNLCTGSAVSGALKGAPLKMVMVTQDKLGYLLLVKPEVQRLADLRGKTIGISTYGSQLYLTTVTLMRNAGLEPGKDLNLLPSGDNRARLLALDAKRIDAAFVSSPFDIFGVKQGYKVLLWTRDHVPLTQNVLTTTDNKLSQSPDLVKRTIKGTIEALKFIRGQKEETVEIASKWLRLDPPTTRAALENYIPLYSSDGSLTDGALRDLIQYEVERAKSSKEIPLSQIADRTLLWQAQKELNLR